MTDQKKTSLTPSPKNVKEDGSELKLRLKRLENQVQVVEHALFGKIEGSEYVPGLLQNVKDMKDSLATLVSDQTVIKQFIIDFNKVKDDVKTLLDYKEQDEKKWKKVDQIRIIAYTLATMAVFNTAHNFDLIGMAKFMIEHVAK